MTDYALKTLQAAAALAISSRKLARVHMAM